ncbi:OmpP1/FadL family transporter [Desulfocurvibacter africanus]|uniref:OmpP1/FadL family transporter n=1 Tax=Desulfocurvibacter africanus TaxID=873 RepID=UPI001FCB32ED|nr:OmpP1/FadL family transporter [Desulfocurvibacter africanus]
MPVHSFRLALIAAALILFGASSGYGAGFAMYEYGARGNALGGGLVGRADDPSALAYNPAGITQLEGTGFMAGFTTINPEASVEIDGTTYDAESKFWTPPHLYATQQLNDTFWLGFGVYSRYGLGIEYDENWAGRYNVYEANIQSLSMSPTLAVKVTDWLSVAAGPEIMWFEFSQKKKVDPTVVAGTTSLATDVDAQLDGDSWGYGGVASIHITPADWLRLGATYRSQVKQEVKGEVDFTKGATPLGLAAYYSSMFNDTDASGTITLPDSYTFGVAVYPTDKLSLEFDAIYTRWSSYDELKIEYDKAVVPAIGGNPAVNSYESQKDWDDVWRFQFSAEYALLAWLDLRASYVFDESPIPDGHADYMVPANDRHMFGVGTGFHITENLDVDLAYNYLHITDRKFNPTAEQSDENVAGSSNTFKNGHAHMYALSVGYRF